MAAGEFTERLNVLREEVDVTCLALKTLANKYEKSAGRMWALDVGFRSVIAVLSVAAPALVTYSTTQGVSGSYKLFTIFLTGVAGAATTLQAIFGFKQSYLRAGTSALDLHNAALDLRSEADIAFKQKDEIEAIGLIRGYIDKTRTREKVIVGFLRSARLKDYENA
jgi:hypothetical protein